MAADFFFTKMTALVCYDALLSAVCIALLASSFLLHLSLTCMYICTLSMYNVCTNVVMNTRDCICMSDS